jgi:hypothetical protein
MDEVFLGVRLCFGVFGAIVLFIMLPLVVVRIVLGWLKGRQ